MALPTWRCREELSGTQRCERGFRLRSWVASCPSCGFQLASARTQERCERRGLERAEDADEIAAHRAADAAVVHLDDLLLRVLHEDVVVHAGLAELVLQLETGGRCAGQGCCPDQPDPLQTLIPHHTVMFSKSGRTGLDESLAFCETSHHDLHEGKKTLLLRDGRYLNENGFTTEPPWPQDEPPF